MPQKEKLPYDPGSASDEMGDVKPVDDLFPEGQGGDSAPRLPRHWDAFPVTTDPLPGDDDQGEEVPLRKRSQRERLQTVIELDKFIPQSNRELNLAVGQIENREKPLGFARYLNEVLLHQKKSVSEDPEAALRKIIAEIAGFIDSSVGNITSLELLIQDDLGSEQLETVRNSLGSADWRAQPMTRRALDLITRQLRVREQLADDEEGKRIDVGRSDDDEIAEVCKSMRRHEAVRAAKAIIEQQRARSEFWRQALRDSRLHMVTQPLAAKALEAFDSHE